MSLLHVHYGPGRVQEVSDERGDLGIECFCADDGVVWQCYAPATHIRGDALYEAHRKKISSDVLKFIRKKNELVEVLGPVRVKKWILVVPRISHRDIVAHCHKKAAEVVDKALPYVAPGFQVVIQDVSPYAIARESLARVSLNALMVDAPAPTLAEVETWIDSNASIVSTLDSKISKIATLGNDHERKEYREQVVADYLLGQNLFEDLRRDYKLTYERVMRIHAQFARRLKKSSLVSADTPAEQLDRLPGEYKESVRADVGELANATLETIASGAIAAFLVDCSLNFKQVTHA
ncbi:MAG TPA: hypothetical protein VM681_09785 [Candidatus Thermoplasmatota archaeon]|nr:hypothetical protein [Candidatus Thermoplasmatota archaeon]